MFKCGLNCDKLNKSKITFTQRNNQNKERRRRKNPSKSILRLLLFLIVKGVV